MMKISLHGHRPSCFDSAEAKQKGSSNDAGPQDASSIKPGFFKLNLHRNSATQRALLEDLAATRIQSAWRGHRARKALSDPFAHRPPIGGTTIEADFADKGFHDSDKTRAHQVPCDDPLFYLIHVRKNKKIKTELHTIDSRMREGDPALRAAAKQLVDSIMAGNWDYLSHDTMKNSFPENHPCHSMAFKRLLFYVYWKGEISRADFETGLSLLGMKEQFKGENSSARYRDVRRSGENAFLTLPGEVKVCRYFNTDGTLTPEARRYIGKLCDGFSSDSHTYNAFYKTSDTIIKKLDEEKFIRELRKLPAHQQVFFSVRNIDGSKIAGHTSLSWWYREILAAFANTPSLAFEGSGNMLAGAHKSNDSHAPVMVPERMSFDVNSYGAEFAFQSLFTPIPTQKAIVQPVSILGSVGPRKLAEMHAAGWHPVTEYDPDVKNLLFPHDMAAGPAIARIHDMHFHALYASQLSIPIRQFYTIAMPEIITGVSQSHSRSEKLTNALIEAFADLNMTVRASDWTKVAPMIISALKKELEEATRFDDPGQKSAAIKNTLQFYQAVVQKTKSAIDRHTADIGAIQLEQLDSMRTNIDDAIATLHHLDMALGEFSRRGIAPVFQTY